MVSVDAFSGTVRWLSASQVAAAHEALGKHRALRADNSRPLKRL
jgi:hypothetical protein